MGGECFSFAAHVVRGRWFMVFATMLIMTGSGTMYVYIQYSKEIEALGYDEAAMNKISFYRDFGSCLAIFNGLIVEVIPTWLGLFLGATMNFGGYFMIWLAVRHSISKPPVWQMCLYIAVATNSSNFYGTVALVKSVQNLPVSRGVVLGLMKGLVGLGGAVIIQIYYGILKLLFIFKTSLTSLLSHISIIDSAIITLKFKNLQGENPMFQYFLFTLYSNRYIWK